MYRLTLFVLLNFLACAFYPQATALYSKAYGKTTDPAVIFLHGGPGYNAVSFELSSAQDLADKGLYVIVFDQRGSGRSAGYKGDGDYSFNAQAEDVLSIYQKYSLKKASLIGHSWGGTLATKFAEKYPDKVEKLIFVNSPLSYQMTLKAIIEKCRAKFSAANDSSNLKRLNAVSKLDTASLVYSSMCLMYAMNNGLYATMVKTESAKAFAEKIKDKPEASFLSKMNAEPTSNVYKSEKYTTLNLTADWQNLKKTNALYGIYGSEDGLFDQNQLNQIKHLVGEADFYMLEAASHNVFIDQHEKFISLVARIIHTN